MLETRVGPSQKFPSFSSQGMDSSKFTDMDREVTVSDWIVQRITEQLLTSESDTAPLTFLTHIYFVKRCFSKLSLY